jgi:Cof subfamily protein (haloacid dehalogenase superfamily)
MKPRFFVFDLDGTLLNSSKEITPPLIAKLAQLKKAGHQMMIATGRAREITMPYLDLLKIDNEVIFNNGAQIIHVGNEEVLFDVGISSADVEKVIQYYLRHAIPYSVSTSEGLWTSVGYDLGYYQVFKDQFPDYPLNNHMGVTFERLEGLTIYKILAKYDSESQLRYHQTNLQKVVEATVTQSMEGFLSVLPTGITKGTTLIHYLKEKSIALDQVIVFGDNDNDIEMLSLIPHSYAMLNGSEGAKKAAAYLTKTDHNQYGVLTTLENMNL